MHLEIRTNYNEETPRTKLFFVDDNQRATFLRGQTVYGFVEFQEAVELLQNFYKLVFNQNIKIIYTDK